MNTPFFIRLRHWEYWSSTIVYAPLYPYYLWLSIRARSFYFLTAANPLIRNGGFIMESKNDVYNLIPKKYYPATLLFQPNTGLSVIQTAITNLGLTFPVIAKPDIGERGLGVKKIDTNADLEAYVTHMPVPFLVQQYVPFENEVGIFYCKIPGTDKGTITGIVNKEAVKVTGDGQSTLAQLVAQNERYILQWKQIKTAFPEMDTLVIEKGREVTLVPYGNHSRGSKFTDETFRVTPKLNESIDRICSQIPEFYFGRLDIRFRSWEALERGEDLSIIEVNGSGSEPTHIYDPKHSIFFAWREIIRHWQLLFRISMVNNMKGVPFVSLSQGRADRNAFRAIEAQLSVRVW